MFIAIPGRNTVQIHNLVLDFNGTIALDGELLEGVGQRLEQLSRLVSIHVITADTNGSVRTQCGSLPVTVHVIGKENQRAEKKNYVLRLDPKGTVSIGNGSNDEEMFAASDLAIAVIGKEGCAASSLLKSDIVATDILDALDLLLKHHRLIATLRA